MQAAAQQPEEPTDLDMVEERSVRSACLSSLKQASGCKSKQCCTLCGLQPACMQCVSMVSDDASSICRQYLPELVLL